MIDLNARLDWILLNIWISPNRKKISGVTKNIWKIKIHNNLSLREYMLGYISSDIICLYEGEKLKERLNFKIPIFN